MFENSDEVMKAVHDGYNHTPYLKIKVNANLEYVKDLLDKLHNSIIKGKEYPGFVIIYFKLNYRYVLTVIVVGRRSLV